MALIDRSEPASEIDIESFLDEIHFKLPADFIDFYKESNGADITGQEEYLMLWPMTSLIKSNMDYNVETYAPDFFLFGSNGGGEAYSTEKHSGFIYAMPFIGMSREEALFKSKTLKEFIEML